MLIAILYTIPLIKLHINNNSRYNNNNTNNKNLQINKHDSSKLIYSKLLHVNVLKL